MTAGVRAAAARALPHNAVVNARGGPVREQGETFATYYLCNSEHDSTQ